jgi:hypothetical protein
MIKRQTMAQLFRDLHRIESQVALLRLDLQAAGVLPKPKIEIKICTCTPPRSGTNWVTASAADWKCPLHGGLMQNAGSETETKEDANG